MNIEERVDSLEKEVNAIKQQMQAMSCNSGAKDPICLTDERLGLSRRALNVLARIDCETIDDALRFGLRNLRNVHGCGLGTAKEIIHVVENAQELINGNR